MATVKHGVSEGALLNTSKSTLMHSQLNAALETAQSACTSAERAHAEQSRVVYVRIRDVRANVNASMWRAADGPCHTD